MIIFIIKICKLNKWKYVRLILYIYKSENIIKSLYILYKDYTLFLKIIKIWINIIGRLQFEINRIKLLKIIEYNILMIY